MKLSIFRRVLLVSLILVVLAACAPQATAPTTPIETPIPSVTPEPRVAANVWLLGTDVGGQTVAALKTTVAAQKLPPRDIMLNIGTESVPMTISAVSIDTTATVADIMAATTGITVTPVLRIDAAAISSQLGIIAQNLASTGGVTLVDTDAPYAARFVGNVATTFDIPTAERLVIDAIERNQSTVTLPVSAPAGGMPVSAEVLNAAVAQMAERWQGIVGIYVLNLDTNEVVASLNENTVFSGASVMKVPILIHAYANVGSFTDKQVAWMRRMIIDSDNIAANRMLATSMGGEGTESAYQGAQDMNKLFTDLGLEHTYQNLPYEARDYLIGTLNYTIKGGPKEEGPPPHTDADPMLRTTPREMATVFHALYQCSQNEGPFRALYPETLTAERCSEMLMLMRENADNTRMMRGMPDDVVVSHKSGWIEDMQADVGIVTTPAQQHYLMAIYVYRPIGADGAYLTDPVASDAISGFAQLIHSAFVPGMQ
jgi:beta-lactamase class A